MPTETLVPDGTSGINQWSYSGGSSFADSVDDSSTSEYIYETLMNHYVYLTITNPSVAEADIDFDEDVTVTPKIYAHHTGTGSRDLEVDITGAPGSGIVIASDTIAIANDSSYPLYSGTSHTEMSSGTDWTYAGLEDMLLYLKLKDRIARFQYLRVSYAYLELTYTEAATGVVNNAILFGSNF